jgi:hypothetical protein
MPGLKPLSVVRIDNRTQKLLGRMLRRETLPRRLERRIQIILKAAQGHSNCQITCDLRVDRNTVRLWRACWAAAQEQIATAWLKGLLILRWSVSWNNSSPTLPAPALRTSSPRSSG